MLVAGGRGGLTALRGGPFLHRTAAGRTWRTSAGVFWQVHPAAADVLAGVVSEVLRPQPGDVALDLYCGAGLFAGVLAAAVGPSGAVIGVESDRAAVRDARHNLRDTPWARVHRGDVAEVLGTPNGTRPAWPCSTRPGPALARPVLDQLLRPGTALRRVAYVSCDPATLARDIAVFAGGRLAAGRAPRVRRVPHDPPRRMRGHADQGLSRRRPEPSPERDQRPGGPRCGTRRAWPARGAGSRPGARGAGTCLKPAGTVTLSWARLAGVAGSQWKSVWRCQRIARTGRYVAGFTQNVNGPEAPVILMVLIPSITCLPATA